MGEGKRRPAGNCGVSQRPHHPDADTPRNTGRRKRRLHKTLLSNGEVFTCKCAWVLICVYDLLQTDWRAELLDAVRQVFMRERSVLKSALYSHLDLLDTSDAVIHLNQLERRLSEQVRNKKLYFTCTVVNLYGLF